MTSLTEALERIMNWLQQHKPDYAGTFLLGLSHSEITERLGDFHSQVPQTIYELYRWRNGTRGYQNDSVVFPPLVFLPLEDAVELCLEFIDISKEIEDEIKYEGNLLFPFLEIDGDRCAVLLREAGMQDSPIIHIGETYSTRLMYSSLTSMMQTLAECYETGGYYIAAEGLEEEGFTVADESKVATSLRKYNPEMNANALAVIQTLLLQETELSKESLEELYSATSRMRWFKDPNLVNILIEALSSRMSDFPEQNLGIRSDIIHTLGQLNDVRAVEPLISALKDNFQLVRYRAAIGLGEIGDSRAIDPLVESLEDIDEQVRSMASHSLVSLKAIEPIILAASHCNAHVRE